MRYPHVVQFETRTNLAREAGAATPPRNAAKPGADRRCAAVAAPRPC